ncbi:MAG: 3-deoxy-D-manno-octulosonic acid transferase [Pseudomonadota bacterium]
MPLFIVLYNLLFFIITAALMPIIPVYILGDKKRKSVFRQRLCFSLSGFCFEQRPIWIHALSVGEALASIPLVEGIKNLFKEYPIAFSCSTHSGFEIAKKSLGNSCCVFYAPYDTLWGVRKAVRQINPAIFILLETDLWPNLLFEMKRIGVPSILANVRISPQSFKRYALFSWFTRQVFSSLSCVAAQTQGDAEKLEGIGVDPARIKITGNIKFDMPVERISEDEVSLLKKSLYLHKASKVFLAGSTHGGEEEMLIPTIQGLKKNHPDLVMLIAPRDIQRADAVRGMFERAGFNAQKKTLLNNNGRMPEVIVLDTIGELRRFYSIADIVFIGGSFVNIGGHNPLEPAMFGKPILFGPYMYNFAWIADALIQSGGAIRVNHPNALQKEITRLIHAPVLASQVGENALRVLDENRGSVNRTIKIIAGLMAS